MIQAGIIGGAGYTGGELLRILMHHPECNVRFVQSRSHAGKSVSSVHRDLIGECDLNFSDASSHDECDVLFLCLGHGESREFLNRAGIPDSEMIVDLTQDFRFGEHPQRHFVYGLPEANRPHLMNARNVANPGCFATAIELSLLPLAAGHLLPDEIHVSGITGSTGAGQRATAATHFSWRSSNISVYKPFEHQHLREISILLQRFQTAWEGDIYFVPYRGNFTRGIITSSYVRTEQPLTDCQSLYESFYAAHPFVHLTAENPDIKQVMNTNKALLYLQKKKDVLHIVTVIDNLVKGASGQAVQNMNLMCGLEETSGLQLKPVAF